MRNSFTHLIGGMVFCVCFSLHLQAQTTPNGTISGRILNTNNQPLAGCTIKIQGQLRQTFSDEKGDYELKNILPGRYVVVATKPGYDAVRQIAYVEQGQTAYIGFMLSVDAMEMDTDVETGTFSNISKLESSVGITTLSAKAIEERASRGTGDLLAAIPGTFVDASGGEVGAIVFPRGLSTGQNNQLGFRYVSLQEEGLPIMSTQLGFALVDMFHRTDATVGRLEAIRGGTSSIITNNSPGGIFNFISKTGGQQFSGSAKLTGGLNNNQSPFVRLDAEWGAPLKKEGWAYHIGGFFRRDEGARTVPFIANQGGQIKANLTKTMIDGQLKFYFKHLNDRVTFFKQIPVLSLDGKKPFGDFDVNNSSTFLSLNTKVPNSAQLNSDPTALRSFDSDRGIGVKNSVIGMTLNKKVNDWQLNNNAKVSLLNQQYQQFQGNFVLPTGLAMTVFNPVALFPFATSGPLPSLPAAPAPAFPTYRDATTGEILGKFNSINPDPSVPNQLGNFVLGTAALNMQNRVIDVMNNFSATYTSGQHRLTVGAFGAYSQTKALWNVDFLVTRFTPNGRPLITTFASPYSPATIYNATDTQGLVGYNAGAYTNFKANSTTLAAFLNDYWDVSYKLKFEIGLRYEAIFHNGYKKGWSVPNESDAVAGGVGRGNGLRNNGGLDGNFLTTYDNRFRLDNGTFFRFNDTYQYLSASVGFSHKVGYNAALYGRATLGNKAPDIDYYVQNFVNQPITQGTTEKIWQGELGYKYADKRTSFTLAGFYSYLDNILFQLFIPSGTTTLFTPPTFNAARTIGAELDLLYTPNESFTLNLAATLQDARFVKFMYYNTNGTTSPQPPSPMRQALPDPFADDFLENFGGNRVNDIPQANVDVSVSYKIGWFKPYGNLRLISDRYGNKRNTVQLPAFGVVNFGIMGDFGKFKVNLHTNNLLNSKGIMLFDGIGVPGGSVEDLAPGGVRSQNPTNLGPNLNGDIINAGSPTMSLIAPTDLNAVKTTGRPYMVRPILPRLLTLSLSYRF
ncbi:MAG: TonB-dependent receptor [Runella sp.]